MADLKDFQRIYSDDFDISKLQDALLSYINSLKLKIQELEDRLEDGGL